MTNDDERRRMEGWVRFNREKYRAERERDADPIRKARSDAWRVASLASGNKIQDLISAANASELEVRRRLGISGPMDTSKLATDGPCVFPSDARAIDHVPDYIREREGDKT